MIHALLTRWQKEATCPLYFDFGKSGPPSWIEPQHALTDPLWDGGSIYGDYWKVHGWHEARWVRLYSPERLAELRRLAERHRPHFVMLAPIS